ncbi:MAG: hypothetical protein PHC34_12490 [Candidatus Gastranaerophilales bacterium]|nr:hypothetical protein [Candidatus Gastranaerophilales bacterium]
MNILDPTTSPKSILYIEESYNSEINSFIVENYEQIVKAFSEDFHINFLYLPYVLKDKSYIEQLQYNHPTYDPSKLVDTDIQDIYRDLIEGEGKTGIGCGLLSFDDEKSEKSDLAYELNADENLIAQFYYFAQHSRKLAIDIASRASSFMGFITKSQYEVLKEELQELFLGDYQAYLDKTEKGSFKHINEVCAGLKGVYDDLQQNTQNLSRLKISGKKGNYKVTLTGITPPNGPKEVKMGPLPMTLLIFFLNRPDGMKFTDLQNHISALNKIYCELSKSMASSNQISPAIRKLVDTYENSMHENSSLLKRAFIEVMSPFTASNYYIDGNQGGVRKISLPRHLVNMDPTLKGL